jgi:hypothetical protein
MASAEKMAPTKVGMGWFINVWISDAGHVNPLLHKFFRTCGELIFSSTCFKLHPWRAGFSTSQSFIRAV